MECKRAKVHMLPTENGPITLRLSDGNLTPSVYQNNEYHEGQHLYLTTDDDIKEGDWFTDGKRVYFNKLQLDGYIGFRKIVATTDESLTFNCDCCKGTGLIEEEPCRTCISGKTGRLPQPSQAFIEKYCEVGGIDEVDIEYARTMDGTATYNRIKVDSHNTVTIHPIKTSWNRQDVVHAIAYAVGEAKKGFTHAEILQSYKELGHL